MCTGGRRFVEAAKRVRNEGRRREADSRRLAARRGKVMMARVLVTLCATPGQFICVWAPFVLLLLLTLKLDGVSGAHVHACARALWSWSVISLLSGPLQHVKACDFRGFCFCRRPMCRGGACLPLRTLPLACSRFVAWRPRGSGSPSAAFVNCSTRRTSLAFPCVIVKRLAFLPSLARGHGASAAQCC